MNELREAVARLEEENRLLRTRIKHVEQNMANLNKSIGDKNLEPLRNKAAIVAAEKRGAELMFAALVSMDGEQIESLCEGRTCTDTILIPPKEFAMTRFEDYRRGK